MIGRIPWILDFSIIAKVILENYFKKGKLTPLTIEKSIFLKKSILSNGKRSYQPKYHIPR